MLSPECTAAPKATVESNIPPPHQPCVIPVRPERRESNGQFRDQHGKLRHRTFTSRPAHGVTRVHQRADFTHNPARLVDIATETRSLVNRLEDVYNRPVGPAIANKSPPRGKPCNEAPTSRNRKLFSERVAAENLRIYNRLQQIKPSRDTSSAHLRSEWQSAQKISANISRTHRSPVRLRTKHGN
eukprot:jgi/Ulvmu1/12806/UM097_0035.1